MYRMHPLIPDDFSSARWRTTARSRAHAPRPRRDPRAGAHDEVSTPDLLYSFGTSHPGAITLHNFPRTCRRSTGRAARRSTSPRSTSCARANGACRATASSAGCSTSKPRRDVRGADRRRPEDGRRAAARLRRRGAGRPHDRHVRGAEAEGFGFSDTAFRVFILMASRRLKSDRFFTRDYRPEVYTKEGFDWVEGNSMRTCCCATSRSSSRRYVGSRTRSRPGSAPAAELSGGRPRSSTRSGRTSALLRWHRRRQGA